MNFALQLIFFVIFKDIDDFIFSTSSFKDLTFNFLLTDTSDFIQILTDCDNL